MTDPRQFDILQSLFDNSLLSQEENGGFVVKRLMLIPLLFLWPQTAVAASPIIVDSQYVAEAIARNAVVWDYEPPTPMLKDTLRARST